MGGAAWGENRALKNSLRGDQGRWLSDGQGFGQHGRMERMQVGHGWTPGRRDGHEAFIHGCAMEGMKA